MTNLKRVLSLALAAVMLMGMMVIGAGAANIEYTDAESIENAEAVEVLTALDVLGGYPDGSFKPEGTLTRAEAAAVICRIMLGADVAESLSTATAPFADVKATNWAAGYLAYLKNLGVISGIGNNKYNPQGTVTVGEFAKMLLGAAGIDGQFTGSSWLINVTVAAQQADILSSSDKVTDVATRDAVAGYTLNAMFVGEDVTQTTTKYVTSQGGINTIHDTYAAAAEALKTTGTTYGGSITVTETVTKDSLADTVFKLKTVTEGIEDAFGRPATAYTQNGKEIAKFASDAALVFTTKVNNLEDLNKSLKAAGLKEVTAETKVAATNNKLAAAASTATSTNISNVYGSWSGNGNVVELYDTNNDKTVDTVVVITPSFAEVDVSVKPATKTKGAYTEYTVSGEKGVVFSTVVDEDADKDTASVTGTIADGDMVLAYRDASKVLHIAAVSTVSGVYTALSSTGVMTISGSSYEKAAVCTDELTLDAKEEQTFYVDSYGYILGVKAGADAATNYAQIIDKSTYNVLEDGKIVPKYEVVAVQADGTVATFTVASTAYGDLTAGKVYTYITNSKGVTTFADATTAAPGETPDAQQVTAITKDNAVLTNDIFANNATKFYVVNWTKDENDDSVVAGTVTVYTGIANVPSYADLDNAYAVDTDKTADTVANVVFVYDNVKATVADEYIYLTGEYTTTADGTTYSAIVKGEATTITIPTGVTGPVLAKGLYASISIGDSTYTATLASADESNIDAAKVQNVGGLLFVDGSYARKNIANDVAVYCIDTTENTVTVKTGADLTTAIEGTIYVVTDGADVVSIYVLNA